MHRLKVSHLSPGSVKVFLVKEYHEPKSHDMRYQVIKTVGRVRDKIHYRD
jgi:hypothetical protein